jgi:carboxymethylenebutenolidase
LIRSIGTCSVAASSSSHDKREIEGVHVAVERLQGSCDIGGLSVVVESFVPCWVRDRHSTVILLHGRDGADGMAGDRTYQDVAAAVAEAGFQVVLPHYFDRTRDCGPPTDEATLDFAGGEIERFGLWLETIGVVLREKSKAGQPIGLIGYSLGGYLALTAAMAWRGIGAVAVCYAGIPTPFAGLAANLPPTLTLHGEADRVVPAGEASALAGLLRRHRVRHEMHIYPGANHGFCGADAEDAIGRVVGFLTRHLRPVGGNAEPR